MTNKEAIKLALEALEINVRLTKAFLTRNGLDFRDELPKYELLAEKLRAALEEQDSEPVAWAIFADAGNVRMWTTFQPHIQKLADSEGLTITPLYTAPQPQPLFTRAMVDRFLTWPLPTTVCADPCASAPGWTDRTGNNLLTAEEAEAMLRHVLGDDGIAAHQEQEREKGLRMVDALRRNTYVCEEGYLKRRDEKQPAPQAPEAPSCTENTEKCTRQTGHVQKTAESVYEPFGYFKAEPFGWTDCAATDEGAIPLYEKRQPLTDEQIDALELSPSGTATVRDIVRLIEQAHRIKVQS